MDRIYLCLERASVIELVLFLSMPSLTGWIGAIIRTATRIFLA